jgi:phosphoribosylformimino-5-aminoimidazole carboxamide ribonucleotide (ProFAR) isomerase
MMLVYSEKAVQPSISVAGGTISSVTYYTGACELTVVATGEVEIIVSGTALKESKIDVITPSGRDGETITVSNPLITNRARAAAIGALAESILKNRRSLKSSWRADPRLDVLDIVRNVNEYGENHVLMTNVNYQYNGACRGSGEGRAV